MKQIIAMGGLASPAENELLFKYILAASNKPNPKICFIPTAGGDNSDGILLLYSAFAKLECRPSHLSLIYPTTADLRGVIFDQDIVLVSGGNTKNMLALWREWSLDTILRDAYESGIVLSGWSAGAICWFDAGTTDSIPGPLTALPCLGFLPGSCSPHYDGEPMRRPAYHDMIRSGKLAAGIALEDTVAAHFIHGERKYTVSSRAGSKAYWVENQAGKVSETAFDTRFLG
jgi:dipeptidase E